MIQLAKQDVAELLAQTLRKEGLTLSASEILSSLEVPKVEDHGHLAYPVFVLAKEKRQAPPQLAAELATKLQGALPTLAQVQAVSGFVNFTFTPEALQGWLLKALEQPEGKLGQSVLGQNKTVVIDFSSPNIAKKMHIGHFRATVIGQAITNLQRALSYKVVAVNHIGDWGTQFGKLAWAYQEWGSAYDFSQEPIESLLKLYVRFHQEAETNPELEKKAAEIFLRLERGDEEIHRIWKFMVDASFVEYNRIYELLGIRHDVVLGESFYNDKMEDVVKRLEAKGLLKESEGAQVVFFEDKDKMPPCLIKKSDGASIYATRDLAAAIYRHEVQKGDMLLYVVGAEQSLHFRQVFKVLELLGYDWSAHCHHVSFGAYRFKEGKMSTRKGQVLMAEDLIHQAIDLCRKMIEEKNPTLENKEQVAREVAAGAIIFNDLINDRVKNVEFEWERALNTEGDSGPYVQYTHVRCRSLMRKYGREVPTRPVRVWSEAEEQKLVFSLLQFAHAVEVAGKQFKPNVLAQYLLEVCGRFSRFYHAQRVLGESAEVEASRMRLVQATARVIKEGLSLLNIPSPEMM